MLTVGFLTFMTPAILLAAAVLPAIWLLLRLTPPALRRLEFPAARLLFNLRPTERTSARTPPWLLLLRIGLLLIALLGLADPVLTASRTQNDGPLVLVVDDGWAAATQWDERQKAMRALLERADHHDQQVALITTAPTATELPPPQFLPARDALAKVNDLAPLPWSTDRAVAAARVRDLKVDGSVTAVWVSDGVASPGDQELATALERFGAVRVLVNQALAPLVLVPPQRSLLENGNNRIAYTLRRVSRDDVPGVTYTVRALDAQANVLARTAVELESDARSGKAAADLPLELANRIARFDVESHASAATTILADGQWQRRPVGVASTNAAGISAPLLEDAFYVRQALEPFADVRTGVLDQLLERPLSVLIMTSGGKILDAEIDRMKEWVEKGGVLVRFAGPRLDTNVDDLLPVRLRAGGRSLGGALSWTEPARLDAFPELSPFKNLALPEDVTVTTQVLAEPSPDLSAKTWARLKDGTPLVTAEHRGQGWVVLFHVTATPEWSSLPLSGLFVDVLRRVVDMSAGVTGTDTAADGILAPLALLDGLGRLNQPGPTATPIAARALADAKVGPDTPPGLYGPAGNTVAFNLPPHLTGAESLRAFPSGATREEFATLARERALKPWFLSAALALLIFDLILSFVLRGLGPEMPRNLGLRGAVSGIALLLVLFAPTAGRAAEETRKPAPIDPTVKAAVLETRLAYVVTGNPEVDRICDAGLRALTSVLAARTSAELAEPAALSLNAADIGPDALSPYPVIYWRITPEQARPNPKAAAAISAYLRRGGMVVFDAPEQAGAIASRGAVSKLEEILSALDVPSVVAMPNDHVLTRSFYLLAGGLPGRFGDATIYVDKGSSSNDGVASVIIGGNDWASAWARDASGLPMYAAVPGGERQREMAYRAGVNIVMFALTGNYKSDQVHLPAIMQRLTQ